MCNQRYEDRHDALWKLMCTRDDGDKNKHKVISYWCPRGRTDAIVTGVIKSLPDVHYDRKVFTSWATERFIDTFCLKGRKGDKFKDKVFKKGVVDENYPLWQSYNIQALDHYLQQAVDEGSKCVIISWQEYKLLGGK